MTLTIDPDNTIATASGVTFSGNAFSITDTLGNGASGTKDVDMFSINVTAADVGRTYAFTTSQPTDGKMVDTYLKLFNANGTQLAYNDDFGKTLYAQLVWTPTAVGTYYLGVSSYENRGYTPSTAASGPGGKGGDYRLDILRSASSQAALIAPHLTDAAFEALYLED